MSPEEWTNREIPQPPKVRIFPTKEEKERFYKTAICPTFPDPLTQNLES